jgi:hypothetical protein
MRRLALLLDIPIMIILAVAAHADPDSNDADATFLASLRQAGITYQSPDQAVAAGKKVCDLISSGKSAPDVVQQLISANPGFTTDGATKFAGIAANAYCPDQLNPSGDGSAEPSS